MNIQKGDIVIDKEENKKVRVEKVMEKECKDYVVEYDYEKNPMTLDEYNEDYPPEDIVVMASYLEGSSRLYAFPVSRLDKS